MRFRRRLEIIQHTSQCTFSKLNENAKWINRERCVCTEESIVAFATSWRQPSLSLAGRMQNASFCIRSALAAFTEAVVLLLAEALVLNIRSVKQEASLDNPRRVSVLRTHFWIYIPLKNTRTELWPLCFRTCSPSSSLTFVALSAWLACQSFNHAGKTTVQQQSPRVVRGLLLRTWVILN